MGYRPPCWRRVIDLECPSTCRYVGVAQEPGILKAEIGAIAKQLPSAIASEGDVVRYSAAVSVWGRWFVWLVTVSLFVYRPGFVVV